MLAGELYLATDPQLVAEDQRARELLFLFNATHPDAGEEWRALHVKPKVIGNGQVPLDRFC